MTDRRTVPLDSQGRINADVVCVHCGYNLRGLAADGVCAECGKSIGPSTKRWAETPLPRLGQLTLWLTAAGYAFFAIAYVTAILGGEDPTGSIAFVGVLILGIAFLLSAMAVLVRAEFDRRERIKLWCALGLSGLPIGLIVFGIVMLLIHGIPC